MKFDDFSFKKTKTHWKLSFLDQKSLICKFKIIEKVKLTSSLILTKEIYVHCKFEGTNQLKVFP